jgi:DNA-binding LacI/PurR family transcriptional regulator
MLLRSSPTHPAPTLADVASAAQVSVATVSRHLRGVRKFQPEVAERIDKAVKQLGYRVNGVARSMVTGRTGTVGVAVLDLSNPHFTALLQGAQRVARERQVSLAFVDTAESTAPETDLIATLAQRVDGLVVSSRLAEASFDRLLALGRPVVCFGPSPIRGLHTVGTDGRQAALLLAQHLVASGRKRVLYAGYGGSRWNADRLKGLRETLHAAGGEVIDVDAGAPTADAGKAVASSVLLTREPPDAVVGYNDLLAIGLMNEAQRLGFSVPGQLAVAGFDDIVASRHCQPSLTSVSMNSEAIGARAIARLMDWMDRGPTRPGHEALPPLLHARDSTRAASVSTTQGTP